MEQSRMSRDLYFLEYIKQTPSPQRSDGSNRTVRADEQIFAVWRLKKIGSVFNLKETLIFRYS